MQRLNQTAFSHARSCSAYGRSFLWALILVVTCKYVLILLRAHNKGEGGTPSLMALAQHAVTSAI
jgi:K+ transporter